MKSLLQPKHVASLMEGMAKGLRGVARRSLYLDCDCQYAHDVGYDFGEGALDMFEGKAEALTMDDYFSTALTTVENHLIEQDKLVNGEPDPQPLGEPCI